MSKRLLGAGLFFLIIFTITFLYGDLFLPKKSNPVELTSDTSSVKFSKASTNNVGLELPDRGIHNLLSVTTDELKKELGMPLRVDPSAYGYNWWIYKEEEKYIQVGVSENKVVSIYAIGKKIQSQPFEIGSSSSEILSKISLTSNLSVKYEGNNYRFELSEEEMLIRPLVRLGDYWVQLYFDKYTQKLSSIRYMTTEVLIKQRPYAMVYRGELIEPPKLTTEEWYNVEVAEQKQILDITNMIREVHDLPPLEWHQKTAEVALSHSKEMFTEQYFSHISPKHGDLSKRLEANDISYLQAGENIAANYIDGIAVVQGWLNSKGHRETMLNEDYSHLGVGVYKKYYTQNFLIPFEQ